MNDDIKRFSSEKRSLITGGSGYLATNLIQSLEQSDCSICRISRKETPPSTVAGSGIVDANIDLLSKEDWLEQTDRVDVIYHFAAQTSVYVADQNPVEDLSCNVTPMQMILNACRFTPWGAG